jgi:hypothetical protein
MGRSQRHMLYEHNYNTVGELFAQGIVAPVTMAQVEGAAPAAARLTGDNYYGASPYVGENSDALFVPIAEPGGPLSGSTMSGAIPEIYDVPPQPTPPPVLTSLNPATVQVNAADLEVHCIGSDFTATSAIVMDGIDQVTQFYSATDIATFVSPTARVAGIVQTYVRNADGIASASLPFEYTA